ncbi:MAG: DNA-binding protein [Candidatus Rokuibacteriota bacterium]|nr:MAG: DNA-binding protein [Candidatus Rokubacteria bacterium 13_2_20CM_69_15_1]PYN37837.1 MAG: DNA-binding protein [Candidatus Rokubacteria bacterium]
MPARKSIVVAQRIERAILLVGGQKVMLDADLAALYRVPTKVLVQAVKRNLARFPNDFMFRLTVEEAVRLRSQIVTSNVGRGGRRYSPYAFTEHGVAMLSSVLRSSRAIQANIAIMRAFVRQRGLLASNEALARKLDALEKKYDAQFKVVFDAIRQLMSPQAAGQRTIGFRLRPGEDKLSRLRPHRA